MRRAKEKVLFMMTPGRRHLVIELDETYSRRDLDILLKAFRKKLAGGCAGSGPRSLRNAAGGPSGAVDRIVGPGFVIEMLGLARPTKGGGSEGVGRERNQE